MSPSEAFRKDLEALLNRHSIDTAMNTPDFLLVLYIVKCLDAYKETKDLLDEWSNR